MVRSFTRANPPKVVIDLARWYDRAIEVNGPGFERFQKIAEVTHIKIDWPDYGVPMVGKNGWEALVKDLENINGKVIVACTGGHGRTGTTLAIIGYLSGRWDKAINPIRHLRGIYCDKAVESYEQREYVYEMTGFVPEDNNDVGVGGCQQYPIFDDSMATYHNYMGKSRPRGQYKGRYLSQDYEDANEAIGHQIRGSGGLTKCPDGIYRQAVVMDMTTEREDETHQKTIQQASVFAVD
jgi:hypothetical protein